MKKIITSAAIAATLLLSGCATQTYVLENELAEKTPTVDKREHFFVSGLGQTKIVNAGLVCGGAENIAKVETKVNALDGVLSWLTFNIYTPRQSKVYCVDAVAAAAAAQ